MNNINSLSVTKCYIIDLFNDVFFSNMVNWGGVDKYNELPILAIDANFVSGDREYRSCLLVNNSVPTALRCIVTAEKGNCQKVCYRVSGINSQLELDTPKKKLYPQQPGSNIDFSMAHLNVGVVDRTAYTFYSKYASDVVPESGLVFNLLKFILSSDVYIHEEPEIFTDLVSDLCVPPIPGDDHYKLVYGL